MHEVNIGEIYRKHNGDFIEVDRLCWNDELEYMVVYHKLSSEAETYCEKLSDFTSRPWIVNPFKKDGNIVQEHAFAPIDDLNKLFKETEANEVKYRDKYDSLRNYVANMVAEGYQVPIGLVELINNSN